jgi:hypothetical protein
MRRKPYAFGAGLAALVGAFLLVAPQATFAQMYSHPATASPPSSMMDSATRLNNTGAKPLSRVKDPSTTLASASVSDSSGQSVGQVQSVKTSASGTATSVAVSLNPSGGAPKVVSINADDLTYDASSNKLKASLTTQEITQLPAIQSP